jgi:HAMP domain-containing protein
MKPTIRNKLVTGFCGVLVLMAAVAGIGWYAVTTLKQGAYDATRIGAQLNAIALEIQVHNLEAARRVNTYLVQLKSAGADKADGAALEESAFEIHEIQSLVTKAAALAPTPATQAKFTKIALASADFQKAVGDAVDASKKDPGGAQAAKAIGAYEDAAMALHEGAEDGELAGKDASQTSLEAIDRTSGRSVTLVTAISLLGMAVGIVLSYKLSRAILVPVEHLKNVAENVSLGNLDIAVRRYSEDEIGDLADSFSRMVAAVKYFRMESEMTKLEAGVKDGAQ